jgi:hypothetical protein
MTDFLDAYAAADDANRQYALLRDELARVRGRREDDAFYDPDAVGETVARLAERVDGALLVFAANDFGVPRAYRPPGIDRGVQDAVRQGILQRKYDGENDDLDEIRRRLLDEHPGIHKAIVAAYTEESLRYHLPEGSKESTNFLTVREMVGLVDYTTNSAQADGLSRTY